MMTPRQTALAVDIATGAIVISVAVALAGLTWRLTGDPGTPLPAPATTAAPVPPVTDLGPALALAPFGRAMIAGGTELNSLTLRGILLATPRATSTALISINGAPPTAFAIGQSVGPGTIETIETDQVMLRVGDGLQALAFPKATIVAPPSTPTAPSMTMPAPMSASTAAILGVTPPPPAPPPAAAAPPRTLIEDADATKVAEGYRIGANVAVGLRRAGLQTGDVVAKVNGVVLGDPDQDRQVLAAAAMSGTVAVEIIRDGKRVSLSFPVR